MKKVAGGGDRLPHEHGTPLLEALESAARHARNSPAGTTADIRLDKLLDELERLVRDARSAPGFSAQACVFHGLASGTAELRALADSSTILFWLSDRDRAGIYFNTSWLRFTGQSPGQELGQGWLAGLHPDDRPDFERQYAEAYLRREAFRAEVRLRRADGRYCWISNEGNPLYDDDGQFLGFAGFCTDVDDRKRIEIALDLLATHCAKLTGAAFYEAVCRHIASTLELDFVFVGELSECRERINVRGGWGDGRPMPAMSYPLAGSPCEGVLQRAQCVFPHAVASQFPQDTLLTELHIEAYCGTALLDVEGVPFGLMVGLSRQPLESAHMIHALMDVFDDRIGAELQRERSAAALDRRVAFERLVSDLSGRLIVVHLSKLDDAIEEALGSIGEFLDGDRVYVFSMPENASYIINTHEWCGPGIRPEIHNLQEVPFSEDIMFARKIRNHQVVDIPDVALLEEGSVDRVILESQAIRSTLAIPMVSHRLIGFIGVDAVRVVRRWTDEDKTLLRLASNAFTSVFERKLMDENLRASEERYRSVVEKVRDVIFQSDPAGKLTFLNAAWTEITGHAVDECIGRSFLDFTVTDDDRDLSRQFESVIGRPDGECRCELRCVCRDGSIRWFDAYMRVNTNADGEVLSVSGTLNDITERKQAIDRQKLVASVFTHANEAIVITDAATRIIEVNEAFSRITGFSRAEVVGRTPMRLGLTPRRTPFFREMRAMLEETGQWQGELRVRHRKGEDFPALLKISSLRDERGRIQQYVALFSDITAQKNHQQQLEYIAQHDALTGLPNRVLLQDRLQQGMAHARRRGLQLAVVYIDLDGFKSINDRYGHHVGDQLLIALAMRMKATLREADSIARLGGDEFVAVLVDLADMDTSMPMVMRLLATLARPVTVAGHELRVSASIGLTLYPQTEDVDADQLLRQADLAMYEAKLAGKNRYHIFDTAADRSMRGHHENVARIRKGLKDGEFILHYQPKVNMRTGQVIGAEALIRWQHPEDGLIGPAAFLPVIEDHPAAVELGEWVIDTALAQVAEWKADGLDLPVSVNIGARHLQDVHFMDRLRALLAKHPGVSPQRLELEVLETSALESMSHVSRIVEACAEIGVSSALDDFGTGYSSLAYLKRLPAANLKIDQLFVRDMLDDPDDLAILEAVLGLARAFRRGVIAEGVETSAHGKLLLQLGCEFAQGFGIARPMAPEQMVAWAANWQPPALWRSTRTIRRKDVPLAYAIVEHRALLAELEAYSTGNRNRPPELDNDSGHLRNWLDAEGRAGDSMAAVRLDGLHSQMRALAAALVADVQAGSCARISEQLAQAAQTRDRLIACLEELLEASA